MATSQYPKREWGGIIAQWLTIATVVVSAIYWLASLEEAKDVAIANHTEQQRVIEKHADRIRELENSRRVEDKLAALTAEVAALNAKVDTLLKSGGKRGR